VPFSLQVLQLFQKKKKKKKSDCVFVFRVAPKGYLDIQHAATSDDGCEKVDGPIEGLDRL